MIFLEWLMNYPTQHPYAFASICTGSSVAAQFIWSAFVQALPAPTAKSSEEYKFWFKFFNILAANIIRARGPRVEESPNFQDAVNIQNKKTGEEKIVVEMPEGKPQ